MPASRRSRWPTSTSTRTSRRRPGSRPGVPAYVDALVARATARDRAQRPADAGVLLHQLHRVSQALAGGVWDDAELTADLALPASTAARAGHRRHQRLRDPADRPGRGADRADAAPVLEPQRLAVADRRPARSTRRSRPSRPARPGPAASRRGPAAAGRRAGCRAAGRGRAPTGSAGRATPRRPASSGLSQQAAVAKLDHAGLDVEGGHPGILRDRPQGPGRQHRPCAGCQGAPPRHGDHDDVAGQGALRRARRSPG